MATEIDGTALESTVIDLRDPPPTAGAASTAIVLDDEAHRRLRLLAVAMLVVLNVADLVTTRAFLEAGVPEGNPIAAAGLDGGWIPVAKAALLVGLGLRALRSTPRLVSTCGMWFVVGVYAAVVTVNLQVVRAVGASLF